ncbi:MAG: YqcC family protein [Oleispira sp.]|nr:YqcC family protein [Oleispira sp.]
MANHKQVRLVLQTLQKTMLAADHWSDTGISTKALASQQPFCLDTMNFSQWLQFVFISRMQILIDAEQVLPRLAKGQGLEPMASEFYKSTDGDRAIMLLIRQLDDLLQD